VSDADDDDEHVAADYAAMHRWSVEHMAEFWALVWQFGRIVHSMPYTQVVDNAKQM